MILNLTSMQKKSVEKIIEMNTICYTSEQCRRGNRRFSGKHYENSPEKIKQLKEKYKNGISLKTINEMLELNL